MLPDLQLRKVGARHVASVLKNGQREDVGELQEAHLRAYCASLPGSYTVPTSQKSPQLNATGSALRFAEAVQTRKNALLSSDNTLGELEAHRMAASQIAKETPSWVAAYRADVRSV